MKKLFTILFLIAIFSNISILTFANEVTDKNLESDAINYSDDEIIVILTNEESIKGNKYTVDSFAGINCVSVDDLTSSFNSLESKNFKRILKLSLSNIDNVTLNRYIDELNERNDVYYAGYNYEIEDMNFQNELSYNQTNNMPRTNSIDLWGLDCINITQARNFISSYNKSIVKVGVVDYGVEVHKELSNIVMPDLSYSFVNQGNNENNSSSDDYKAVHGTMVAGIIGSRVDNKNMEGVCSDVKIGSLEVDIQHDLTNNQLLHVDSVISAINYAVSKNMRIINCSFGFEIADIALYNAMKNFNGLFVCGAGNSYNNVDSGLINEKPLYPAAYDLNNIVSVGAINVQKQIWHETIQGIEIGSNYGTISVDVFAPGVNIQSTSIKNTYSYDTGTSFAAPYVTGIAAMILSIENYCDNAPFSGNDLREIIMMSATQSNNLSSLCRTSGYVDAKRALEIALSYEYNPSYEYHNDTYHKVLPYLGSTFYEDHTWVPMNSSNFSKAVPIFPLMYECSKCKATKLGS